MRNCRIEPRATLRRHFGMHGMHFCRIDPARSSILQMCMHERHLAPARASRRRSFTPAGRVAAEACVGDLSAYAYVPDADYLQVDLFLDG